MTRRRWIADEVEGSRAALVGAHAEHLARVLRARVGQEFDIAANGEVRRGLVMSVDEARVEFELGDVVEAVQLSPLTLLLAVFKFDRFEWAVEKCTELGATTIVPVIARRTDAHLAKASDKRVERWRKIAREASEQSRRVVPPEIAEPVKLKQALAAFAAETPTLASAGSDEMRERGATLKIVLSEVEDGTTLRDVVSDSARSVAISVGPEGGWTDEELKMFADAGWKAASLGETILRAETAAIAATAIVRSV